MKPLAYIYDPKSRTHRPATSDLEIQPFSERVIRKTKIADIVISTVFLGFDHSFSGDVPILYETMAFIDNNEYESVGDVQKRYATAQQAIIGHYEAVEVIRERLRGTTAT